MNGTLTQFMRNEQWHDAVLYCEQVLAEDSGNHNVRYVRALAFYFLGDLASAYENGLEAFNLSPGVKEYSSFLSVLALLVGRAKESYFYAKNENVCTSSDVVRSFIEDCLIKLPDYTDALKSSQENPLLLKGVKAFHSGDMQSAESWFQQHIKLYPTDPAGHYCLVDCLLSEERLATASEALRGALHLMPDDTQIMTRLATTLGLLGQFDEMHAMFLHVRELGGWSSAAAAIECNTSLMDPRCTFEDYKKLSLNWVDEFSISDLPDRKWVSEDKTVLNVGWVLTGADMLRFGPYLSLVLSKHDSSRYQFFGFGSGDFTDQQNIIFQKCFVDWRNTAPDDPYTLYEYVKACDIDVLINCSGFSAPDLLSLFGSRIATVQGLLGGDPVFGLPNVDFQLLGNEELSCRNSYETSMGGVYLLTETSELLGEIGVPRSDNNGIVFGADVLFANLTAETVEIWSRLLKRLPEATLVLRNHDFEFPENTTRLIRKFGDYGLSHRVDILPTATSFEYLKQIDVFLTPTRMVNLGPALDALAAGVPVIYHKERDGIQNLLTGVLEIIPNSEAYIAHTDEDYLNNAVFWVKEGLLKTEHRMQRAKAFLDSPYFDYAGRMADVERLIEATYSMKVKSD